MAEFKIRLAGDARSFVCDAGDPLLRGALRQGLGFPYECNVGSCGSCKFELVEGEVEDTWPEAPGLSERDRRKGRRLGCQSLPSSDCTVAVRLDDACVPAHRPALVETVLSEVRPLTHDMSEFRFVAGEAAAFLPGQYALLRLPGVPAARAYSMSNLPNDAGEWDFQIKRVPGGAATAVLFDRLSPGDAIGLDGPFGLAYWREDSPRDVVCIAGGSGLSPMISIARAAAHSAAYAGRPIIFFHGGRRPEDMCGEDLLRALPGGMKRIAYHPAVSEGTADGWNGATGFIHEVVCRTLGGSLERYDFYLAGPPPMVKATIEMLALDRGVPTGRIYFDSFF